MAIQNPNFAPLLRNSPIADENGNPTPFFIEWIQAFQQRVVDSVNGVNTASATVQAASAQVVGAQAQVVSAATTAVVAQQQANTTAGNTTQSGAVTAFVNVLGDGSWAHGPTVALTSVVAGHLALGATGPSQASTTTPASEDGSWDGSWQVVEIIGLTETQVATGQWRASRFSFETDYTVVIANLTDASQLSIARTTTGAVSYRLDLNLAPGSQPFTHVRAFLSASRGP